MKNCLVTKLNGTVDNDNLTYVGERRFYPKGNVVIEVNDVVTMEIVGDAEFPDNVPSGVSREDEKTIKISEGSAKTISFVVGNGTGIFYVRIYPIYNVTRLEFPDGVNNPEKTNNLSQINYATNAVRIVLDNNFQGDLKWFEHCYALERVTIESDDLSGDIDSFAANTALKILSISGYTSRGNSHAGGSIESLAGNTALENIVLQYQEDISGNIDALGALINLSLISIRQTGISGSINSLLTALHTAGKRTNLTISKTKDSNVVYEGTSDLENNDVTFTFDDNGWHDPAD